jgi:hypothetical protein
MVDDSTYISPGSYQAVAEVGTGVVCIRVYTCVCVIVWDRVCVRVGAHVRAPKLNAGFHRSPHQLSSKLPHENAAIHLK